MKAFFDAVLGRIFSRGVEVPALGGVNFAAPLVAVADTANRRINVSLATADLALTLSPPVAGYSDVQGFAESLATLVAYSTPFVYVDQGAGSDSNAGTSEEAPLASLDVALAKNPGMIFISGPGGYSISDTYLNRPRTAGLTIRGLPASWSLYDSDLEVTAVNEVVDELTFDAPGFTPGQLVGKIALPQAGGQGYPIVANTEDTITTSYGMPVTVGALITIVDSMSQVALPEIVHGGVSTAGPLTFAGVELRGSETFGAEPKLYGALRFGGQGLPPCRIMNAATRFTFLWCDVSGVLSVDGTAAKVAMLGCTGAIAGRFADLTIANALACDPTDNTMIGSFFLVGVACENLTLRHSTITDIWETRIGDTLTMDRFSDFYSDNPGPVTEGPYSGVYPPP